MLFLFCFCCHSFANILNGSGKKLKMLCARRTSTRDWDWERSGFDSVILYFAQTKTVKICRPSSMLTYDIRTPHLPCEVEPVQNLHNVDFHSRGIACSKCVTTKRQQQNIINITMTFNMMKGFGRRSLPHEEQMTPSASFNAHFQLLLYYHLDIVWVIVL